MKFHFCQNTNSRPHNLIIIMDGQENYLRQENIVSGDFQIHFCFGMTLFLIGDWNLTVIPRFMQFATKQRDHILLEQTHGTFSMTILALMKETKWTTKSMLKKLVLVLVQNQCSTVTTEYGKDDIFLN